MYRSKIVRRGGDIRAPPLPPPSTPPPLSLPLPLCEAFAVPVVLLAVE